MTTIDNRPGLTFKLKTYKIRHSAVGNGKHRVEIILDAHSNDVGLMQQVHLQLDKGVTIYTAQDLDGEITKVMREEIERLEKEVKDLTNKLAMAEIMLSAYQPAVLPRKANEEYPSEDERD